MHSKFDLFNLLVGLNNKFKSPSSSKILTSQNGPLSGSVQSYENFISRWTQSSSVLPITGIAPSPTKSGEFTGHSPPDGKLTGSSQILYRLNYLFDRAQFMGSESIRYIGKTLGTNLVLRRNKLVFLKINFYQTDHQNTSK